MGQNPFEWNETIQKMNMKKIGMSDEEIADVLATDKKIDKGEKLFELTPDQEKESKKARQVSRAPTAYKFTTRERKKDADKAFLMETLEKAISPECDKMEIINPEREFTFFWNGKKYKVVLSAPRK